MFGKLHTPKRLREQQPRCWAWVVPARWCTLKAATSERHCRWSPLVAARRWGPARLARERQPPLRALAASSATAPPRDRRCGGFPRLAPVRSCQRRGHQRGRRSRDGRTLLRHHRNGATPAWRGRGLNGGQWSGGADGDGGQHHSRESIVDGRPSARRHPGRSASGSGV